MDDPILQSKVAEAAHAAAIANEATSNAREEQMYSVFVKAMKEVLKPGEEDDAPLLIKRVPFICQDIKDIKNTLWWQNRIASVIGVAGLALICALIATIRVHL
jgi:hypothetical protein